jgi:hypothetical protein
MKKIKLFENFSEGDYKEISIIEFIELADKQIHFRSRDKESIEGAVGAISEPYIKGLQFYSIYNGFTIYAVPDEYFIVTMQGKHYKCDQLEGLFSLLKKTKKLT